MIMNNELKLNGISAERLEQLSEKVRAGEAIDFSDALAVIEYQEILREKRRTSSIFYKLARLFDKWSK